MSDGRPTPQDHTRWWTLVAVCLGTFMLLLDITIVNVALPDIQRSLGSSFADLQWVVDAYALTLASFLLTAGSLADTYGRRRLYLAGLVVFTGASVLCGAASSTLMLELCRGLQGIGGAVMFSVSLALLANAFRGRERGVAFGVWGAINGVAVAVGPVLGGALVSGFSWRAIFLVNVPIGLGAVALTVARVVESRERRTSRPDWAGFGLFSGGAIAAFGISASLYSMLLYLVLYLQDVLRYSAFGTGLRLLVLSGCVLAVSGLAGRLTSHVPVRLLIGAGLVLTGVGLLLMRGLDASSSWTHLIAGLAVAGIGSGFVNPPLASTAVGVVAPQRAGMASGINSTFRQVGIATGIALLGTLFSNRLGKAVVDLVSGTPLAGRGHEVAAALRSGEAGRLFRRVSR